MATLRDIRRRIGSVKSTMQITSAMRMVSAAKLARAQVRAQQAQPYARALAQLAASLCGAGDVEHPLLRTNSRGKTVLLLYTSDRGLAGPFNSQIIRVAAQFARSQQEAGETVELWLFGRKGEEFFRRRELPLVRISIQEAEPQRVQRSQEAAAKCSAEYQEGALKAVYLAYNHFHNPVYQEAKVLPLLPIAPAEEAAAEAEQEILFEPSRQAVLDDLLPAYVRNQLLLAHLNTEAGEHGARMVAMESATKNAEDMIKRLTLQYNRARQASITRELIEIINGAQAL